MQLFIPTGSNSLFSRLDGHSTAFIRHDTLERQYSKTAKAIEVSFGDKQVSIPATDMGYGVHSDASLQQIPHVTLTDKLIPGMAYVKLLWPRNAHTTYSVNSSQRTAYIRMLSNLYSIPALDAKAFVNNKFELTIQDDKAGQTYSVDIIDKTLKNPNFYGSKPISIKGKKVEATLKPNAFKDVTAQSNDLKGKALQVAYANKKTETAHSRYLSKLEVITESGKPKLQFSAQGVSDLVVGWAKAYGLASGIDSTNASADKAINVDVLKKQLASWLVKSTDTPITIPTIVIKSASATNGLQSAVSSWVSQHGNGYYVVVHELGGGSRSAVYNASKPTVLASTYKVFVAWTAYRLAEQDQLSLDTVVYNGQTIEQCIATAIINSDNECAKAVGKYIGWAKIQSMVTSAGFSSMRLNNYFADGTFDGDKTGSASDMAKFLRQLQSGTLMNSAHTNTMLGYMKQQIYRSGVPAGSGGSIVADKVGFLDNYTHDAAIVYGPRSTYVVVIMSDRGGNWVNIKSLATVIYNNLN